MRSGTASALIALVACSFDASGSGMSGGDDASSSGSTSEASATGTTAPSTSGTATTSATVTTTGSTTASTSTSTTAGSTTETPTTSDGSTGELMFGDFGPAIALNALNDPNAAEDDPCVSPNHLELYFNTNRNTGNGDIWVSRRNSVDDPWGAPSRLNSLSTADEEGTPRLSPDGLTIRFNRSAAGTQGNDIFIATRPDTSSDWSDVQPYSDISSADSDLCATLVGGTNRVLLCSNRGPSGTLDMWEGTVNLGAMTASGFDLMAGLNTDGEDCCGHAVDDGLTLYYYAQLPGSMSGSMDLYVGTRADLDTPFDVEPVDELNTDGNDADPWLSSDGRTLYFARYDVGASDLFYATREPL